MSETATGPAANYCYRHPDRQSWVLCQRCGRTICGQCQNQAPVGVHCPECTREASRNAPRTKPRILSAFSGSSGRPVATYTLVGINLVVFLLMFVTGGTGGTVGQHLFYYPPWTIAEPWRLVTSLFAHAGLFHILFNMYALFLFGVALEAMLGRVRFLVLYFLSGLGGSAAMMVLAPGTPVVGASGAVFGLFSAFFIIQRRLGVNSTQLLVVIALNLAIGFFVPGIAWQAHLGGVIAGALAGLVFMATRRRSQHGLQALGLIGVFVLVLAALLSRYFISY